MKTTLIISAVLLAAGGGAAFDAPQPQQAAQSVADPRPPNAPDQKPAFAGQTDAPLRQTNVAFDVVTVAEGLEFPWGLAFLPSGKMLVTERPGRLRVVAADGTLSAAVAGLPAVDNRGQGGLLDVVLDPDFKTNQLIYWSYSEPRENGENNTAVARGRFVDDAAAPRVENVQVIYHQRPSLASRMHYGSRLVWARDGTLFVTQGDRSVTPGRLQAQNMGSGIGKIVRINKDGSIPKDNPFVGKDGVLPEIWSSGHRNIQSAALHPTTGELWEVEHGTRGGDELNIARKGKDYGWPTAAYGIEYRGGAILEGLTQKPATEQPIYYWDPVIAPSGMLFYTGELFPAWKGSLFIGGLQTTNLVRLDILGERVTGEERLIKELKATPESKPDRIRDVRQGPEGAIYVVTDMSPGRVLKIVPKKHPAAAGQDWPQFRGPGASGIADTSKLPERWSATENVAWKIEVPGHGWSSPIVLGDRVYVTSAISEKAFKAPSTGIFGNDFIAEMQKQGLSNEEINKRMRARDLEGPQESGDISYRLYAIDAKTGAIRWQQEAHRGLPPGGRHRKNTYASETPATDGERLYASFGANVGLFCYTLDGTLLWSRTWPPQPIYLDFGTASSPIVHRGQVFVLHDNEGESFLAALDAKTGKDLWRVTRTGNEGRASGWSTPFIWDHGGRTEVVTLGRGVIVSYDLEGRELWRMKGITQAQPTPVAANGMLFVGTGSQGETGRPIYAIRPGASGDISLAKDQTSNDFVAWHQPRFAAYTPSPLVYRGRVYVVNNNGVLQVADEKTGVEIYKARVGGGGQTFSSSPLASDGRIYLLSEDGDMFVLRAGDTYDEIAKNSLGEMSLATPAPGAGSLFIRTQTKLYRIGA